jgi:parallel beta-helix repeat protein
VYKASFPDYPVLGVTEMDGPQYRYAKARDTMEHLREKMSLLEVVKERPSTYFYDRDAQVLYIHTSDGAPPSAHEIEIFKRGNGIYMVGKHYVTIIGFTFRHMGDAGINFFRGSGDGIAINNTSYGSRQGIRVYAATSVIVNGNTLFRNENCGVYFAAASTNGLAIGNTAYENIKGVRWSSDSASGMAIDNILFDNHENGIALESVDRMILGRNRVVNNTKSQLLAMRAEYTSDANCFGNGAPEQLTADFVFTERYKTLAEYQRAKQQDLGSREGNCGPLPAKVDVRKLHAETMAYAKRARQLLSQSKTKTGEQAEVPPH